MPAAGDEPGDEMIWICRRKVLRMPRRNVAIGQPVNEQHRRPALAPQQQASRVGIRQIDPGPEPGAEEPDFNRRPQHRAPQPWPGADPLADAIVGDLAKALERRLRHDIAKQHRLVIERLQQLRGPHRSAEPVNAPVRLPRPQPRDPLTNVLALDHPIRRVRPVADARRPRIRRQNPIPASHQPDRHRHLTLTIVPDPMQRQHTVPVPRPRHRRK
jgi:hypothetical protein